MSLSALIDDAQGSARAGSAAATDDPRDMATACGAAAGRAEAGRRDRVGATVLAHGPGPARPDRSRGVPS
ncbi:hypothetical protein [Streptomyces sp. OR43]|uniref:hypothetical protein n=1 Tax=Streptomyces sp. or43 TaxID=2478957 RepID=UPI0011CEAD67|nr:hypothetical protein [Streptomyces sp. or43]TXS39007.1 hypothetical protein EAO72_38530 [Streptomyces sp. or43]